MVYKPPYNKSSVQTKDIINNFASIRNDIRKSIVKNFTLRKIGNN